MKRLWLASWIVIYIWWCYWHLGANHQGWNPATEKGKKKTTSIRIACLPSSIWWLYLSIFWYFSWYLFYHSYFNDLVSSFLGHPSEPFRCRHCVLFIAVPYNLEYRGIQLKKKIPKLNQSICGLVLQGRVWNLGSRVGRGLHGIPCLDRNIAHALALYIYI